MSKERQRRRAAQEAARGGASSRPTSTKRPAGTSGAQSGAKAGGKAGAQSVAKGGAKAGARAGAKPAVKPATKPGRPTVYRQRRFPPLPWRLKVALALLWLVVVGLSLAFVPTWSGRLGLVVIATMLLPLIVVIVRDPSRRTRR